MVAWVPQGVVAAIVIFNAITALNPGGTTFSEENQQDVRKRPKGEQMLLSHRTFATLALAQPMEASSSAGSLRGNICDILEIMPVLAPVFQSSWWAISVVVRS